MDVCADCGAKVGDRDKHVEWHKRVGRVPDETLRQPCPVCDAAAGEPCTSMVGKTITVAHARRRVPLLRGA